MFSAALQTEGDAVRYRGPCGGGGGGLTIVAFCVLGEGLEEVQACWGEGTFCFFGWFEEVVVDVVVV